VPAFEPQAHDIPLDTILTEQGVMHTGEA
jgi:hypothetical protein